MQRSAEVNQVLGEPMPQWRPGGKREAWWLTSSCGTTLTTFKQLL